jgi:YggT family protein
VTGVGVVAFVLYVAISIFIVVMWARFILDFVSMLAREWRPRGFLLVIAELVYTITDPPVKAVRRLVPPLRAGGVAIDFSWTIVLIGAIILSYIVRGFF